MRGALLIDKAYKLIVFGVLGGLGLALILTMLRFFLDIGPIWTLLALAAGVMIWRQVSASEL